MPRRPETLMIGSDTVHLLIARMMRPDQDSQQSPLEYTRSPGMPPMTTGQLLFWNPGPNVRLSPAEVARELVWGEEVEGLIDLPVKEIIDNLKAEFPQHKEEPGTLVGHAGGSTFEATWTWQHLRIDCKELPAADRQRLIDTIEAFGCMAYEAGSADS
jgi:hypothetical protein